MVQGIESCSKRTPYPVSCTRFRVGDSGQLLAQLHPHTPPVGVALLCALGYICITPRENSWGRRSGLLADQLNWPSRERITPALRFGFAVDGGGCVTEKSNHLRSIPKKCHCGQAGAVIEDEVSDVGYAIRNPDATQAGAVLAVLLPDHRGLS